ncbi:MAG: hypothetical protein RSB47_09435, partial [Ruthenibacterium sp.]
QLSGAHVTVLSRGSTQTFQSLASMQRVNLEWFIKAPRGAVVQLSATAAKSAPANKEIALPLT